MNTKIVISATSRNPELTLEGDDLITLTASLSCTMSGAEMVIDQCEPTLWANARINVGLLVPSNYAGVVDSLGRRVWTGIPNSDMVDRIPIGTEVTHYEGDDIIGVFYLTKVERVGKVAYTLTCVSGLGLLDNITHVGGIVNDTLENVLDDIIGDTFPYQVQADITTTPVRGWLPYDTARNNLHQILLAYGLNLKKAWDGTVTFGYLDAGDAPRVIPDDELYNQGTVTLDDPATRVEVTEHTYIAGTETVTLYDTDGSTVTDLLVLFPDAPVEVNPNPTGLTISEFNENYAIISGNGILTGTKYRDTTRMVVEGTDRKKTITVDSCTMVNSLNSSGLAKRLLAYYSNSKKIKSGIVLDGERPGDYLAVTDAFGSGAVGMVTKMDIRVSEKTKADAELIIGYAPHGGGLAYTRVAKITETGSWTVPAGVDSVRVVVIGGGEGGSGGYDGEPGYGQPDPEQSDQDAYIRNYEAPWQEVSYPYQYTWMGYHKEMIYVDPESGSIPSRGEGGAGGEAGQGANINIQELTVTPGDTITITSVATGGTGGTRNGGSGSTGGDTVVTYGNTTITSADGDPSETGYKDIIDGTSYALPGSAGIPGGQGAGNGKGVDGVGQSVGDMPGGAPGVPATETRGTINYSDPNFDSLSALGGFGGGASADHVGHAGNPAMIQGNLVVAGVGGDGGNAETKAQAFYGCGGDGGNGGGGGGASGTSSILTVKYDRRNQYTATMFIPNSSGGKGANGQQAGGGIVLLYY